MMRFRLWPLLAGVLLSGCVTVPSGPGVVVLPGAGKSFEQFREEDAVCRQYAQDQVGVTHAVQWRYDIRYVQCMYAKGNQVPPPPGTPGHPLPPPPHPDLRPAPP